MRRSAIQTLLECARPSGHMDEAKNFVHLSQGWFNKLAKRAKSFLVLFFKKARLVFVDYL
jgi:hypothetical protein